MRMEPKIEILDDNSEDICLLNTSLIVQEVLNSRNLEKCIYSQGEEANLILLTGLKGVGKSSIINKFIKNNENIEAKLPIQHLCSIPEYIVKGTLVNLSVIELPSDISYSENCINIKHYLNAITLVYIIDIQKDFNTSLKSFIALVSFIKRINCKINYEIFIHKTDKVLSHQKMEALKIFEKRVRDELISIKVSFYLTNTLDYSLFQSFSNVVQKLLPNTEKINYLLERFSKKSQLHSVFLIEASTGICFGGILNENNSKFYNLLIEMIYLVLKLNQKYNNIEFKPSEANKFKFNLGDGLKFYLRFINHSILLAFSVTNNFSNKVIIQHNVEGVIESFNKIFPSE